MALPSLNFKSLLMICMALFVLTAEAKMLPAATANVTREARQMIFLYPNHALEKGPNSPALYADYSDVPAFEQQPRRSYSVPTPGTSSADERFFGGLSNLLSGRPLCPSCPSCPNCPACALCPTCAVCPAPCPATTNAASPLSVNIPLLTSCSDSGTVAATSYGACTRMSAAPTGVFTVTYAGVAVIAANIPTAFIGIITTCPNTKVTVTCGALPGNLFVNTQSGQTIGAAGGVPGGGSIVETGGFVQIMVRLAIGATGPISVQCSWTASP